MEFPSFLYNSGFYLFGTIPLFRTWDPRTSWKIFPLLVLLGSAMSGMERNSQLRHIPLVPIYGPQFVRYFEVAVPYIERAMPDGTEFPFGSCLDPTTEMARSSIKKLPGADTATPERCGTIWRDVEGRQI